MGKKRTGKAPGRPKGSTDDPKKKRKGGRWNDETRAKHGCKPEYNKCYAFTTRHEHCGLSRHRMIPVD